VLSGSAGADPGHPTFREAFRPGTDARPDLLSDQRQDLADAYRAAFHSPRAISGDIRSTTVDTGTDTREKDEDQSKKNDKHGKHHSDGDGHKGAHDKWSCKVPCQYTSHGQAGWLNKASCHPYLSQHYFPSQHSWYGNCFGLHPAYSCYWWLEWWPCYPVVPGYVVQCPTYVSVVGPSTVTYVAVDESDFIDTGDIPYESVDVAFSRELDALAANENAVLFFDEGSAAFRAGDYVAAADAFRRTMLLEPDNAVPRFALANALFALGEYEYATFLVRRGMEMLPEWPEVGPDLRDLYGDLDRLAEQTLALELYANTQGGRDALLLLGYVRFFTGDLDGARTTFEAAAAVPWRDSGQPVDPAASLFLQRIDVVMALLANQGVPVEEAIPAAR